MVEQTFLALYSSPVLQSLAGLTAENAQRHRRMERDVEREAIWKQAHAELESAIDRGGVVEAFVRSLMYIAEPAGRVDDRGYAALQEVGRMLPPKDRPGFVRFKEIVRQQFLILSLDEERAIRTLPRLAVSSEDRRLVLEGVKRLLTIRGLALTEVQQRRYERVETLLAAPKAESTRRERMLAGE